MGLELLDPGSCRFVFINSLPLNLRERWVYKKISNAVKLRNSFETRVVTRKSPWESRGWLLWNNSSTTGGHSRDWRGYLQWKPSGSHLPRAVPPSVSLARQAKAQTQLALAIAAHTSGSVVLNKSETLRYNSQREEALEAKDVRVHLHGREGSEALIAPGWVQVKRDRVMGKSVFCNHSWGWGNWCVCGLSLWPQG